MNVKASIETPVEEFLPFKEAKTAGHMKYLGEMCINGHNPPIRYVANRGCVTCQSRRPTGKVKPDPNWKFLPFAEARAKGSKQFMGEPCPAGHDPFRYVSTRACVECSRLRSRKYPKLIDSRIVNAISEKDIPEMSVMEAVPIATEPPAVQVEEVRETKLHADAPPSITRYARGLIYAELDSVYESEDSGYKLGWSDRKLAEKLKVPRAWVVEVREQFFGPIKDNAEELSKLSEDCAEINAANEKLVKVLDDAQNRLIALQYEIDGAKETLEAGLAKAKAISTRVEELQRASR